jgi:hypothetical protein
LGRVVVTVLALAGAAAMLPASVAAAPVGGASYSGTTAQKERIAMTVARSKRSLSRFAAVVRAACSDGQRDWTQFVLSRGDSSFAIKRERISKRISLGPAGSPAVGHLSVKVRFGRTGVVTGSLSGTWRYSDGTTCSSGSIAFRIRRGRYTPPRELNELHPQHPAVQLAPGQPTPGAIPLAPPPPPPLPPPAPGRAPVAVVAGDIADAGGAARGTAHVVQSINPDVVLTAGDNAYPDGSLDEYKRFYEPTWGAFKEKTRPSPGNHEYKMPGASGYFDYFNGVGNASGPAGAPGEGYYSFDIGSWHMVALNNYVGMAAGSAEEQWLRGDLAATTKPCIAAYWHAPRWTSGPHTGDAKTGALVDELYAAHADLLLTGHNHQYERFGLQNPAGGADPQGIREFVVGTGGAHPYPFGAPQPNSEVRNDTSHGVLELTLHANSYDWDFRPSVGTFTDAGTTACH